jgi:hypothetical protein
MSNSSRSGSANEQRLKLRLVYFRYGNYRWPWYFSAQREQDVGLPSTLSCERSPDQNVPVRPRHQIGVVRVWLSQTTVGKALRCRGGPNVKTIFGMEHSTA